MICEFRHDAGAYVLGALSPSERLALERHLAVCADCATAVRELAGLPGLLARVPVEILEDPAPPEVPLPDTLLPRLVRATRRERLRRTWVTSGLSAAAALLVGAAVLVASGGLDDAGDVEARPPVSGTASGPASPSPSGPSTGPAAGESMVALVEAPVTATLALQDAAWGTRLRLECTYDPKGTPTPTGSATTGSPGQGSGQGSSGSGEQPKGWVYVLVVLTQDGAEEQVATWRAVPGETMRLDAATAATAAEIAAVEVRTLSGKPLLELTT